MKNLPPLFLAFLSGFLLYAAWPVKPFTFLILIAFVPLLLLADKSKKRIHFFGWTYLALFLWNASTTWWICLASLPGGIFAIFANALLMSIPLMGYYNVRRRMGAKTGYIAFVVFWMSFEFIHLNWQLTWPWLTLGNVFAMKAAWVQWYELTGSSGGTLWVLLVNLAIYLLVKDGLQWTKRKKQIAWGTVLLLFIPLAISYILLNSENNQMAETDKLPSRNIVVVQPDADPWDEKFAAGKEEALVRTMIRLSESQIDSATAMVVWPETAVPVAINEDSVRTAYFMQPVWEFLKKYPRINLVTGIEGFKFLNEEHKTIYSQKIPNTELYAERYNSAILMDSARFEIYHKSKFVPGAEALPTFLFFLNGWFDSFGAANGSYTPQDERTVFKSYNGSYAVAPAICYESIFGEFMAEYVRRGANVIAIITNDGWWGDTPGYRQHENYARLRAIETRKWVLRSANTGISCFIDPAGTIIDPQPWDKRTSIKMNIPTDSQQTFFVKHGDLISRIALLATILMLIWNIWTIVKRKMNRG